MTTFPESIQITEVGPRDGLQNQAKHVSTKKKIELIDALSKTGVKKIEASAFVHPKWVPQLADADEVFAGIQRAEGVKYMALVPNEHGIVLLLQELMRLQCLQLRLKRFAREIQILRLMVHLIDFSLSWSMH